MTHVGGAGAGAALAQAIATFEAIEARQAVVLARKLAQRLGLAEDIPKSRRGPYASSRQRLRIEPWFLSPIETGVA